MKVKHLLMMFLSFIVFSSFWFATCPEHGMCDAGVTGALVYSLAFLIAYLVVYIVLAHASYYISLAVLTGVRALKSRIVP